MLATVVAGGGINLQMDKLLAMSPEEEIEEGLVMAMPRRELFAVQGYSQQIALPVLDSLDNESWFAVPEVLADDVEAKEVQVGVVFKRGSQVLLDEQGVLLHSASVPPEAMNLGPTLRCLRELARMGAERLMGETARGSTLCGYLNDDQLEECRPYFILVYEVTFADSVAAPAGMTWVDGRHLRDIALDPVSVHIAEALAPTHPPPS